MNLKTVGLETMTKPSSKPDIKLGKQEGSPVCFTAYQSPAPLSKRFALGGWRHPEDPRR